MSARVLLVNPRITSRARARFPLSLLNVAAALEEHGHAADIVDGNLEPDTASAVSRLLRERGYDAIGMSVMGGPQVETALALSDVVRGVLPSLPIVWGGYFPSLYPDAALNGTHADFLVRDQGEQALADLLTALPDASPQRLGGIANLSWRDGARPVHNTSRKVRSPARAELLPYEKLGDPRRYLFKSFMGRRTAVHQAALGCRFRCTFCGVAAMFRGVTLLPDAALPPGTPRIPCAALLAITGRYRGSALMLPPGPTSTTWLNDSLREPTPAAMVIGPAQPSASLPSADTSQTS